MGAAFTPLPAHIPLTLSPPLLPSLTLSAKNGHYQQDYQESSSACPGTPAGSIELSGSCSPVAKQGQQWDTTTPLPGEIPENSLAGNRTTASACPLIKSGNGSGCQTYLADLFSFSMSAPVNSRSHSRC